MIKKPKGREDRWENFTPKQCRDVEAMTNWQRQQWARAGYPVIKTEHFAKLQRPSR